MNGNRRTRQQKRTTRRVVLGRIGRRCCALPRFVPPFLLAFSLGSVLLLFLFFFKFFSDDTGKPLTFQPWERQQQQPITGVSSSVPINGSAVPIQEQVAVLVFCAKRPKAVENHLGQLLRLRPSIDHFPIIVSQDGDDQAVANKIDKFVAENRHVYHIKHLEAPGVTKPAKLSVANYYAIAQHYKWALDRVFVQFRFKMAIITEDDLDISHDFFAYFNATRPLLHSDPTIWCISAWNDNGNPSLVDWEGGGAKLWRTDFFPGLGWMLRSELWQELRQNWPDAYWDDWMRKEEIRRGRVCIRPEISRSLHNLAMAGKGSSNGLYKNFLSSIRLPEKPTNFSAVQIDQLKKENFDRWFGTELGAAKEISLKQILEKPPTGMNGSDGPQVSSFIVRYADPRDFRQLSTKFGLMADIRAGMPRTAYYGVVPFFVGGVQFFAVHHSVDLGHPFGSSTMSGKGVYEQGWDKMSKYLDFAEMYCTPKRYTGKCDPNGEGMKQWFRAKGWSKRLEMWGEMTVF